jgi:hypothetical protein
MKVIAFDIGIINFCACLVDHSGGVPKTIKCEVTKLGERKDPLNTILNAMVATLNSDPDFYFGADVVLIEQQLGMVATKNFAISSALYAVYKTRDINSNVKFLNPRKKFTEASTYDVPGIDGPRIRKTRGPALKKLSVEISGAFSQYWNDEVMKDTLTNHKKKDDVSDCFLMAALCRTT